MSRHEISEARRTVTLPVSIFIIALNEADRIGRTIEAVRDLSDDIVLVDSGSTDETRSIAESLGARVVHREWLGYGLQKRFAEDQCRYDWLLNLDADEVVTMELKREIEDLFERNEPLADAYALRIVDVIPGDTRPRSLAYAHNYVRLYRRKAGRFSTGSVHDLVRLESGAVQAQLKNVVYHFSIRSLGEQIAKFNKYTDEQVADLNDRNITIPTWRVFIELPNAFFKAFFIRRHFMRGTYGFLTAMNYAIFRHLRVAKHFEIQRMRRKKNSASQP
jgi:glycosyltransferase involved in cell wall biosynthesis